MRWHCSPSYCGAVYSNNNKLADGCEINTNTDNNNCGFCGNPCAMGSTCISGTCVPIVTNGDFETGSFAGWATTGCLTSVASGGGAQHGTHYVSGGCTSNPGDSYQQTISLNVGQMYTLSAWYWGNNAAAGTTFYVGGVALFSSSDSSSSWVNLSATFTATSASEVLLFTLFNVPSYSRVDNIAVY